MNNKLIILVLLSLLSLSAYGQTKKVVRNRTCEMCKVAKSISDFSGESNTCIACEKKQAAEQKRKEQQAAERRHQQQLKQERVARERAEKERIAKEQAEKGRIAREKEEKERLARIKAEEACPYVDLGLPSGTLWAKCNVGASKPEEYGDYFAWGETKGYKCGTKTFNWDSYKWGSVATFVPKKKKYQREEIQEQEVKKYCIQYWGTPDGKSVLDLEDDAAYVNLGNNWCMPSNEQFEELLKQCTWSWSTLNGVKGYMVKGKNGKSIFLPSAGEATPHNPSWYCVGDDGYYWSKSLNIRNEISAYRLFFRFFNRDIIEVTHEGREYGMPVRPVRMNK